MAVEQHLLAGVWQHGAPRLARAVSGDVTVWARPRGDIVGRLYPADPMARSSTRPPLPIARVEPLTRTRAVRGPFDYRLASRPGRTSTSGRCCGSRSAGARRSAWSSSSRASRSSRTTGWLNPRPCCPPDCRPTSWSSRCGWPPRLLDARAGAGADARSRSSTGGAAPGGARRVELDRRGRGAVGAEPLTDRQRAALERLRDAGAAVAATVGTPLLRRLERRGLVTLELRTQRRRPPAPSAGLGSGGRRAPALTEDQRARWRTCCRRCGSAARSRSCCTA